MSLKFFDGCGEYYGTSEIADLWSIVGTPTVVATGGRRNGAYIALGNGDSIAYIVPVAVQELIIGFGYRSTTFLENSDIVQFKNAGNIEVTLELTAAGGLKFMEGGTVELGRTANGILIANTWHYIEARVKVDNSPDGEIEIRVDGVQVLINNAVDSQDALPLIDLIAFMEFTVSWDVDDLYVLDPATGVAPHNDFLGDIQIDAVLPDGDGALTEFTTSEPDPPTTHYTSIDENPHTSDTDYVESDVPNDRDMFTFPSLPTITGGSSLLGVKAVALVKKTEAGLAQFRLAARPVATQRNGGTQTLATDYTYYMELWDLNPETSAAWTDALFNASEFGVEVL